MKFLEWTNKNIGEYNVFAVVTHEEALTFVKLFKTDNALSASFYSEGDYFYFINTSKMTITPMPELYLAFGGQYNDDPPYGEKVIDFDFNVEEYTLTLYSNRR